MMRSRIRFAAAGAIAALVLGSTLPAGAAGPVDRAGPAAPAAVPLVANVIVGSRAFNGFFVLTGSAVKVTQKRGGTKLAAGTDVADGSGSVRVGLKPMLPGDRLLVDVEGAKRTITVPDLRLTIDSITDRIKGHVPATQRDATLTVASQVGSFTLGGGGNLHFTARADGTFDEDISSIHDIQGGELVELSWVDTVDDVFRMDSFAPAVTAEVGRSTIDVYGARGRSVTVTLKASNGTVKGTTKVTIPVDGRPAIGTFRKNGVKVAVKAGDRIVHSAATAISFKVLTPTLVLHPASGGDIGATCFPNSLFVLGQLAGGGAFDYLADGPTDSTGALSVSDISNTGVTLPSGYRVMLICEDVNGYAQDFRATVP